MRKMVDVLFRYDEYWNHSVACAVIARYLAERSGKCDPNDTFVAGLFHDIGTLVTPPHRTDLPGAPQTAGIDEHGAAGARILERWNLPASVIEAVRHHHAPERATADPVLAAAVHVADVLCHTTAIARFAPEDIPVWSPAALEVLGLSEPDLQVDQLIAYGGSINVPMGSMGAFDKMVLELRGHLVDILANLPEQQKIVLALCYSEGLSASEVGKLMNIDQRTVTMLLGESFRQLQELMLTRV
jgi:putative nucleotidyltransferase with HDIG domain